MITDSENLKNELSKVGILIDDIYDLVNTRLPYPNAVPVLIELLKNGIGDDKIKEGVIRALTVREAKGKAGKVLLEEYNNSPTEKMFLRWAIGNAMSVLIRNEDVPCVLDIVSNKENGISRQMFVIGLGKIKSDRVEQCLINLLDDDDVAAHAITSLGKLKSINSREKIHKLLNHPRSLIRKVAKKAIERIPK